MNDEKLLKNLLYCSKCFTPTEKSAHTFYIGECMHIFCTNCYKSSSICCICSLSANFIILSSEFSNKLLQNPTNMFNDPVEISMFQLNASLNLIVRQKKEIFKLKMYLKKVKDEMIKMRSFKGHTEKKSLFKFSNDENKHEQKQEPKRKIEKIYKKNSVIDETSVNVKRRGSYLNDITNKAVDKRFFTDYKQSEMSLSSSRSMRLTIPKKDSEFKYVYRKHNQYG